MEFTRYHSLRNILDYPEMKPYLNVFFSEKNLAMFPKDSLDLPLAQVERFAKCRWDAPFFEATNQLLDAVQTVLDITEKKSRRCVALWEPEKDWTPERERLCGKNSVFLLTPEFEKMHSSTSKRSVSEVLRTGGRFVSDTAYLSGHPVMHVPCGADGQLPLSDKVFSETPSRLRPAVVICPGGGYERVCFSGEGNPVMRFLEAHGYVAFVLKYRVAPNRYPAPQEDLALAIRYVRKHASDYGVDPQNIMAMGFSAGAHLCASLSCLYEELTAKSDHENVCGEADKKQNNLSDTAFCSSAEIRPDKLCLAYPVISFEKEYHEGSFQALTGGDESLRRRLSLEKQVTRTFPPVFLWACTDDASVPFSNAVRMTDALKQAGVPHMLRLYPQGGHGCNLAFGTSAHSWTGEMLRFFFPGRF